MTTEIDLIIDTSFGLSNLTHLLIEYHKLLEITNH